MAVTLLARTIGILCLSTTVSSSGYPPSFPHDATSDQPFICDYRAFAWEFAKTIQPDHDSSLTFDALMLVSV